MTHVDRAWRYAEQVIRGEVLACEWVRLQCQRSLDWRGKYSFDERKAEKACNFISIFPHTKGRWARSAEPLKLEDWQCFCTCMIFGFVHEDGTRIIRRARIYVPRKNAKSEWAARIGLYMLTEDGEYAPEVYCGATSEDQAWEVFRPALRMARKVDDFRSHYNVEVLARSILAHDDDGFFKPIIGKPGDGASPHCAITDEYHEHKDDGQLNTMETGMGAREQPLSLVTSTAGETIGGPCYEDWLDLQSVLKGTTEDDELFGLIYTVDPEDDWRSEKALIKANPNYGVSVGAEYLKSQQRQAISTARKQGPFKTKHLNLWVGAMDAYFNSEDWKELASEISIEQFSGLDAWAGLDLASKKDIAALRLWIDLGDGKFATLGKQYLPKQGDWGANNERYAGWEITGHLVRTPGNIIDFATIEADILEIGRILHLCAVGYDPYQGNYLATRLMEEGLNMVEYGATVKNFSDPMKTLDAHITAGTMMHDGDPCMSWMIGNVVAYEDKKENVFPRKARDENKIDGPVSLMMAIGLQMAEHDDGVSAYETERLTVI